MARMTSALDEKPGISPANRSLERGIDILRAFRPGSELLGNAELAERTGLSRSTVSRLTQTLVGTGMLQAEPLQRGYRLAPAVLSLAHAMRTGSSILHAAAPRMRALAEKRKINVGLAAPDRDEMIYLESIRYNRRVSLRSVVSGQRVPMELTSLGRAYLATVQEARREVLMGIFKRRRPSQWRQISVEITRAIEAVASQGYCVAAWQPEVVALATPIRTADGSIYVVNASVSTTDSMQSVARELSGPLMALAADIHHAVRKEGRGS